MTPSTSWREEIPVGEAEAHEALAARLVALQRRRAESRPLGRALHYRSFGDPVGVLETSPNLPSWAQVNIFAAPGRYDCLARFSSGNGEPQPDTKPDARGLAVKVLGVPGKKLIKGLEDATTFDLVCVLNRTMPARTAAEFVGLVETVAAPPLQAPRHFFGAIKLGEVVPTLRRAKEGLSKPVPSLCAVEWHTATPIRWGAAAVKYGLFPVSSTAPASPPPEDAADRLSRDLRGRLAAGPVVFELRIQPYIDEARTPIEDPRVLWEDAVSPWLTVARLTFPTQSLDDEAGRRRRDAAERMSFDPWHAPVELRPLGEINRARAVAYRESVLARGASPEPTALP